MSDTTTYEVYIVPVGPAECPWDSCAVRNSRLNFFRTLLTIVLAIISPLSMMYEWSFRRYAWQDDCYKIQSSLPWSFTIWYQPQADGFAFHLNQNALNATRVFAVATIVFGYLGICVLPYICFQNCYGQETKRAAIVQLILSGLGLLCGCLTVISWTAFAADGIVGQDLQNQRQCKVDIKFSELGYDLFRAVIGMISGHVLCALVYIGSVH